MVNLGRIVDRVSACRICRDAPTGRKLPHEPNPVFQPSATARILLAGQAPGVRAHASGRPFTDPSGNRLRQWLAIDPEVFYDAAQVAILPMGFCYPGHSNDGADLPPRHECALAWRSLMLAAMPRIELVVALGGYAMAWHMAELYSGSVNDAVANWRSAMRLSPCVFPLPHPSWRNNAWLRRNPWFEAELLSVLRSEVQARL